MAVSEPPTHAFGAAQRQRPYAPPVEARLPDYSFRQCLPLRIVAVDSVQHGKTCRAATDDRSRCAPAHCRTAHRPPCQFPGIPARRRHPWRGDGRAL